MEKGNEDLVQDSEISKKSIKIIKRDTVGGTSKFLMKLFTIIKLFKQEEETMKSCTNGKELKYLLDKSAFR